MAINNGDMPAMPQSVSINDAGDAEYSERAGGAGLTKREHFAGLAPDNIPNWFVVNFRVIDSKVTAPKHTDEQLRLACEYNNDNYGLSEDDFKIGGDVSGELSAYMAELQLELDIKCYFAWRAYYADTLLKELECNHNQA